MQVSPAANSLGGCHLIAMTILYPRHKHSLVNVGVAAVMVTMLMFMVVFFFFCQGIRIRCARLVSCLAVRELRGRLSVAAEAAVSMRAHGTVVFLSARPGKERP